MKVFRRRRSVRRPSDDSGVALMTTLVAIMLAGALSILVLGVVLAQAIPTSHLQASSRTIFAAEAGVHAVLGQIRTAKGSDGYGDAGLLPCTTSGPVDGGGGSLRYTADVSYFLEDPTGRSATWLAANDITCLNGTGPVKDPAFALIVSQGEGSALAGGTTTGDRTVSAIYEFQVTNNNIPGGLIYDFDADPAKSDQYCLEAESLSVGSYIRYIPAADCGDNDMLQLWIYDKTYQIKLASSTIPSLSPKALCVTATPSSTGPVRATLQECRTDSARWNQLFSWEGGARWRGQQNPISNGYSSYVLSSGQKNNPNGQYLSIWSDVPDKAWWGSFNPDPRVGAGAAGEATLQIVNYLEFGRCFDVTNTQVGSAYMIVYPCKQAPHGLNALEWNHRWWYTEPTDKVGSLGPQQIYVRQGSMTGPKYCLVSPGTEGGYVTLSSACSTTALNQRWTRYADTGTYATSYTFTDNWGRCISLGDKYDGAWSKITTATCNGGLGQKWNAPPNTVSASLGGYQELH